MTGIPVSGKPALPRPPPVVGMTAQRRPVASEGPPVSASFDLLKKSVMFQTWAVAVLVVVILVLLPFSRPVDLYYAMNPERKVRPLSALTMPNMTDRAVLSWATTSITEVMTMGFGDMETRLPKQEAKFTKKGWEVFMKSFDDMKIKESFKQSQLVLTTVPSNTPVIVAQGVNLDNIYQWIVQMPIIMTYATNNNVMTKKRSTVTLTIVRVPIEEYSFGVAIQNWRLS